MKSFVKNLIAKSALCCIGGTLLLAAASVSADAIIVPGEYATTEANTSDNAPLGATEQHFQQVFSPSLLTGLSVGDWITGIGFRVEGNETAVPAQTVTAYNIGIGQSLFAPGSLSSTFADNRGADFTMARTGPLTINAGDFPGGSSPNNMGWIPFSTPYQYEGGNLLIEISYEGFSAGRDADAAYPYTSGLAQTAFGTGFGSTTADAGIYDEAIVFGFSTISVPEPSSAFLASGFGILLILLRRTRKTAV